MAYIKFRVTGALLLFAVGPTFAQQAPHTCQQKLPSMSAQVFAEEEEQECRFERAETIAAYLVHDGRISDVSTNKFRVGDRIVICILLEDDSYVSLWDASPVGERKRLYPNTLSHGEDTEAVLVMRGERHCIARPGSGFGIRIPSDDGLGRGQFYLLATKKSEDHVDDFAFSVSDWMRAEVVKDEAQMPIAVEDKVGYSDTWLMYEVRDE